MQKSSYECTSIFTWVSLCACAPEHLLVRVIELKVGRLVKGPAALVGHVVDDEHAARVRELAPVAVVRLEQVMSAQRVYVSRVLS